MGAVGSLFGQGALTGLNEAGLLDRFVAQRDERAFALLVARLGPLVLGVCRRMLTDPADVDDAFQATFLVLIRKGPSLSDPERLPAWLYGVAYRVASRARTQAWRRRRRERTGQVLESVVGPVHRERDMDLEAVIDDELARLPARLRETVILCDLEGESLPEAGRRLGCPVGTVKSRLSRARGRLKGRLVRRGVAPGGLACLLAGPTRASIPPALSVPTVTAAIDLAAGATVATPAAALMEGVLRTTFMSAGKTVAAGALLLAMVTAGAPAIMGRNGASGTTPDTSAVAPTFVDEKEIPIDQVLAAVMKAVKARFPKAEVKGAATEEDEDGETIYEVSLVENGKKIDVSSEPEGKIVSIEKEVDPKDLPAKVAATIQAKFPGAVIELAEEVIDVEENETTYDLRLKLKGKEIEATVEPDGELKSYHKDVDPKDLPKAVTEAILAKYPKAEIEEAAEVMEEDEGVAYEVSVEVGETDRKLTLDAKGTILEDEEMGEDEGDEADFTKAFLVDEADLSPTGKNPFFMLVPGFTLEYEGSEKGKKATLTITVLEETKKVGNVTTRVVEERETVDGKIVEVSRNFFAICKRTNNVYYFGEEVDMYKDGKVVSHEGAWLAGEGGAAFGLAMPGSPLMGARYYQEIAPGKAMDRAEIKSLNEEVKTPAGTFKNLLAIQETTPLEPDSKETKLYAPGIGLVQDGGMKLVRVKK